MNAAATDHEFIAAVIGGQRAGERLFRLLNDFADPDALFKCISDSIDADPTRARLRGICRGLQKRIERNQVAGVDA